MSNMFVKASHCCFTSTQILLAGSLFNMKMISKIAPYYLIPIVLSLIKLFVDSKKAKKKVTMVEIVIAITFSIIGFTALILLYLLIYSLK